MERVRFTISVEPDVHAAFLEMAEVSGVSLSRVVGDWLRDTTTASRFVTKKMRELRLSPAAAMRELHAYQQADAASTERYISEIEARGERSGPDATAAERAAGPAPAALPPSSNTGGKGRRTAAGGPKS